MENYSRTSNYNGIVFERRVPIETERQRETSRSHNAYVQPNIAALSVRQTEITALQPLRSTIRDRKKEKRERRRQTQLCVKFICFCSFSSSFSASAEASHDNLPHCLGDVDASAIPGGSLPPCCCTLSPDQKPAAALQVSMK